MALEKLKIQVERSGSKLRFDDSDEIAALFNPSQLTFNKVVNWRRQGAAQRDVPELQFCNAQPRTLTLDLFFDTYDTAEPEKEDVRDHTKKITQLTTVEEHGDKHRPPVCRLSWGAVGVFFQCVLERLDEQLTLFTEDGTPVRAMLRCTFKEWRTNYDDLLQQATESSDIAKTRVIRQGETLSDIAGEEYLDPTCWRPIADANGIDDPRALKPGSMLMIPTLTGRRDK